MSKTHEFATKEAADAARETFSDVVCPVDDDRRLKTVAFVEDVGGRTWAEIIDEAADGHAERDRQTGQEPLTRGERDRFDFSNPGLNVPKLRSIKGIAAAEGVDDWTSFIDRRLTVDEHREVMARAARDESGGADRREETAVEKQARAAHTARGSECDHARGHCENGNASACEFLQETCDVEQSTVAGFIVDGGGAVPFEDLPGEVKGALSRSWTGYKTAVRRLNRLLADVDDELANAEQSASAIVAIEESVSDVETSEFRALAGHHGQLADLAADHTGRLHGQPGAALARREPTRPSGDVATDQEVREHVRAVDPPEEASDAAVATAVDGVDAGHEWTDTREDPETAGTLFEHAENDPERATGPSEDHRRAQNSGYLRSGTRGRAEGVSSRDALGQFTATGGERTLANFETDE
ncbi:hypothetical protein [Halomarina oriensis]|uniref:Uncharacterized protein n=1 Tax=Halomarina oriensis TaxID=671145 RepID=A0A6B0GJG2_9EURY|nr:hypothetical protein [Halomarina oriensis]MWG32963.1 hypothetical protein [Halomarina oriensis]